ncbi:chitin synthase [Sarotherodon galilaeus]
MPESERPYYVWIRQTIDRTLLVFHIMFFLQAIVGLVHINDCRINPFIPIYLSGYGFIAVFWLASKKWCNIIFWSVSITGVFIWFILGTIYIYSAYQPDYNKNTKDPDHYCDKTLYLFAFWTTNLAFVLLAVLVCSCFLAIYFMTDIIDGEAQTLLGDNQNNIYIFVYVLSLFTKVNLIET